MLGAALTYSIAGRSIGFPFLLIKKTIQDPGLGEARVKAQVFCPRRRPLQVDVQEVPAGYQSCEPIRPCSRVATHWTPSQLSKLQMGGEVLQLHLPDEYQVTKELCGSGGSPVTPCADEVIFSRTQQAPPLCLRSL